MSDEATPRAEPALSVVVIAHDEVANLERVVHELVDRLAPLVRSFEIVVVDDGSRDGTGAIAQRLRDEDGRIRVVSHATNRGGGAAIRTGIAAARGGYVLYVPGDGQFEPAEAGRYLAAADGADIVLGRRRNRTGGLRRRLASRGYRALVRLLFGVQASDLNWCKLYRRDRFLALAPRSESWFIDTEVLARARRSGLVVREVEATERPRLAGTASGGRPGAMLATARELLGLARELRAEPPGR